METTFEENLRQRVELDQIKEERDQAGGEVNACESKRARKLAWLPFHTPQLLQFYLSSCAELCGKDNIPCRQHHTVEIQYYSRKN